MTHKCNDELVSNALSSMISKRMWIPALIIVFQLLQLTLLTISEITALTLFVQDTRMDFSIFCYTLYSSLYQNICLHLLGNCLSGGFILTHIFLLDFINILLVNLLCLHMLYKNPLKFHTTNAFWLPKCRKI